ncbi:MAG: GAF domain-containing protein [Actinobacteria bacterium]|nr:GAF domain-containing protein [Actinomycetota bacterium]
MDVTRLSALSDAVMDVAKGKDLKTSLKRLIHNAVHITDCTYGALGSITPDGTLEDFTYVGMSDETADEINTFPEGKGLLGHLLKFPAPLRVSVIQEHPSSVGFPKGHPSMSGFLGVPIRIREELYGSIYLTQKRNGEDFTQEDEELVVVLASAAGIAIDSYRGHIARNQVGVLAERERIARDLHDLVIQQLFASGISLQSIAADASMPMQSLAKINDILENLDSTVQQIRTTIFALHNDHPIQNVRTLVLGEIASLSAIAGFQVTHSYIGPVDTVINPDLARQVIAVIRELVTNAIRHAEATAIDLVVMANQTYCEIRVVDNGKGYEASERKSGLLNLEQRAVARGGEFEIIKVGSSGTRAMWRGSL